MKKLFFVIGLLLISFVLSAQNDCMGTENFNVNPAPTNGGYAPGTTVNYCVTYNNWNTGIGTNWLEGFDITIGPGWDASSITPTTYPANNGGAASGGQWLWIPGTFNGNPASAGGAGNQFGPGFFFDLDENGQSVNDWGDFGTGPWTLCFDITVGNTVGASLSLQVSPVSDGYAGSWGTNGCNGFYNTQLSPGNTVTGCNVLPSLNLVSVVDATCSGFVDGSFDVSVTNGTAPFTYTVNGVAAAIPYNNVGAGNYMVVVEDDEGCVSNPLNVVVGENTTVVNNITSQQDNVCFGENDGSFTITSVNGTQPYTYNLNGVINSTGVFNNLVAGAYNVVVTDDNGCTNNINVNIDQPSQLLINSLNVINVNCFGGNDGSIQIEGIGGVSPYEYQCNSISNNIGIFNNLQASSYFLNIIDANGCEINTNINVTEPLQDLSNVFISSNPTCFGYSNGWISSGTWGGTAPYTYIWNSNPLINTPDFLNLSAGNYQLEVTDANGCSDIFEINLIQPPNILLTGTTSEDICFGDSIFLSANQQNAIEPYNITWTNLVDLGTVANNSLVYPEFDIVYNATLIDANGCFAIHNTSVTVRPLPDPLFTESDVTGCNPICIDFNIIDPDPSNAYQWNVGGILYTGTDLNRCYPVEGVYSTKVVATNVYGCQDSLIKSDHIIINKTPTAGFTITSENTVTDINNPDYTFENTSKDGDEYYWDFGDMQNSTDQHTQHSYQFPGEYCIELTTIANYTNGISECINTHEMCVTINPLSVLYIPSAFTPNDDGVNDMLTLQGEMINSLDLSIYNRSGILIYKSNNLNDKWDGTYMGNQAPDGIYVYTLQYRDINKQYKEQSGTITLLR